jgi:D-alanyl-D-alanine carboxypeptidase
MMERLAPLLVAFALTAPAGLLPPSAVNSAPTPDVPELTAPAWILYDATAGVVIAEQASDEERPMASVTKIMTALVVMDNADLDERVRVTASAAATGEAEIGLVQGERWTVGDLLAAVMVRSGNDAAVALAEYVGGSVEGFADLMNAKAQELGLSHTRFVNPHGLDDDGHYTSAADLVVMAEQALADPYLSRLTRTSRITFKPDPSGVSRVANSTNRLLGVYPGVIGVKTGYTGKAGRVLVSALERNGRTLIGVVMGSEDHFEDSRRLLDYGFELLTLESRFLAPLVAEEGGGDATGLPPLTADEQLRASLAPALGDGQWSVVAFRDTTLGRQIESWMRATMPVTAGGSG